MGKYDTEVRLAKQMVEGWIKESKRHGDQLVLLKKTSVAWEKQTIAEARQLLDSGAYKEDKKAAETIEDAIETGRQNLKEFEAEGQRIYENHKQWSAAGPRKSFSPIVAKLKLGNAGEDRYEAVRKELGASLETVAKVIRDTDNLWLKDLKFAIDTQKNKLLGIATEFKNGAASREQALGRQMTKEAKDFADNVQQLLAGTFFHKDSKDFNDIKTGKWKDVDIASIKYKVEVYKNRLPLIESVRQQLEKNYNRVRKSFPAEYLNGAGKAEFEKITKERDKALTELIRYKKYYETVMKLVVETWKL